MIREESEFEFFNLKNRYNLHKKLYFIFNNLLQSTSIYTSLL